MRKTSILLILVLVAVVVCASWPINLVVVIVGIPAILVIVWGVCKADIPLSKEINNWVVDMQDASRGNTPGEQRMGWGFASIFIVESLLFMIPDPIWLRIGVIIPEKNDLSAFIWRMIELSDFPVSVYVFCKTAPFFIVLACVLSCYLAISSQLERFALIRKRQVERKQWGFVITCCFLFILFPLFIVRYPNLIDSSSLVLKTLKPFQNKLSFSLFIIGYTTLVVPGALLLLVTNCRLFFNQRCKKKCGAE